MTQKTEKKKKDIWFVMNALAAALLVLAVMHLIEPYIQEPDPLKPQIMDYATTIQVVKARELTDLVKAENGKPTLMVVYASWCPTCRWKMPDLIALLREGRLDHVNMVFISRDRELMKLSKYLVHSDFHKDITPYFFQGSFTGPSMVDVLMSKGSSFKGGIPFIELYSPEGRALTYIPHTASKDDIVAATQSLEDQG